MPTTTHTSARRNQPAHQPVSVPIDIEVLSQRSITIECTPEHLYRMWQEPHALSLVMAHFAHVTPVVDDVMHWRVGDYEWDTRFTEARVDEYLRWESLEGADVPNEGIVEFRRAPADRGTEVTLRLRFGPPGSALGEIMAKRLHLVPREIAYKSLKRFKSLVETGEIPTTERQPAARKDIH